ASGGSESGAAAGQSRADESGSDEPDPDETRGGETGSDGAARAGETGPDGFAHAGETCADACACGGPSRATDFARRSGPAHQTDYAHSFQACGSGRPGARARERPGPNSDGSVPQLDYIHAHAASSDGDTAGYSSSQTGIAGDTRRGRHAFACGGSTFAGEPGSSFERQWPRGVRSSRSASHAGCSRGAGSFLDGSAAHVERGMAGSVARRNPAI